MWIDIGVDVATSGTKVILHTVNQHILADTLF